MTVVSNILGRRFVGFKVECFMIGAHSGTSFPRATQMTGLMARLQFIRGM
jgi:hypothetical protein